jgi:hypothetical protein
MMHERSVGCEQAKEESGVEGSDVGLGEGEVFPAVEVEETERAGGALCGSKG